MLLTEIVEASKLEKDLLNTRMFIKRVTCIVSSHNESSPRVYLSYFRRLTFLMHDRGRLL